MGFDPVTDGGATPVSATTGNFGASPSPKPPASFDPERDGGATPASAAPAPSFDPVKAGAAFANADDVKARIASDPTYNPTDPDLRLLYQQEQNQTLGQKAGSLVKGAGEGIASTAHDIFVSPVKGVGEFIKDPSAERAAATLVEGPSQAASGIVGMIAKPFMKMYQDSQENPKAHVFKELNYLIPGAGSYLANKFAPDNAQQAEQRYQDWRDSYLTQLAQARGPGIAQSLTDTLTGGLAPKAEPQPYKEATRALATATSIPMMEAGLRTLPLKGVSTAARGEAGIGSKVVAAGGKATAATGRVMQAIGQLPENVSKWVTEKIAGSPELAEKVSKYVDMGEKLSIPAAVVGGEPLVKAIAATKGLEAGGKIAAGLGDFAARVAEADPAQPLGRFYALAQDTSAPAWMREVASSPIVNAAAKLGRLGTSATKGALGGAAFGAATGLLSGDNPEETGQSIGSGAVFGAGFGMLHGPAAEIREKQLGALAQFVQQHLDAGISPETLSKIDNSTALQAATLQKFLKDKKIMFAGSNDAGSPFAPGGTAAGQAGWWDQSHKTLWVNPENRVAAETLTHEFFHDVWKSGIANHPEIKKAFDASLAANGKTIDDAKVAYAEAVTGYKNDPVARQNFITSMDATNPDWVYSELLSDAAARNLYKIDPLDLANPSLKQRISGYDQPELGGTIFKGFEPVFDTQPIRRLSLRAFRDYVNYRPGLDEPIEQSAPLTQADLGTSKTPFYKTAAGQEINPYGQLVPDGKGGQKFVSWPASEVRRRLKTEQVALDKYFPKGQPIAKVPDTALNDDSIPPWTRAALKSASDAMQNGEAREMYYHRLNKENSATSSKSWAADVARNLGNVQVSFQSGFPLGLERTKNGNLITRWASLEAARQKAAVWADRSGDISLDLWGGDQAKFFADSQRYLQNHQEGLPGDANNIGQAKRDVLNAFWFGDNKEYQAKNPLRSQLKKADRAGVFRSLRVDRMESMNPAQEAGFVPPDYEKGKQNLSPAADKGAAARLGELSAKTQRTPEEESEFQNLQARSGQNNSKEAWASFLKKAPPEVAAASIVDQAAKERQAAPKTISILKRSDFKTDEDYSQAVMSSMAQDAREFAQQKGPTSPSLYEPWTGVLKVVPAPRGGYAVEYAGQRVGYGKTEEEAIKAAEGTYWNFHKKPLQLKTPEVFSPASKFIDNKSPDDIKSGDMDKRRKAMSVGKPLTVFHFSDARNDLDNIDPDKMRSKTTRFWGETPKSFFWTKGSEQPIESEYGNGSFPDRYLYQSKIDGTKIYDASNASKDPLGYFKTWDTDKNALDKKIQKAGFDGVLVSTKDGREVVVMLKKVPAKLVGVTDHDGKILKGKKELLPPTGPKAFEIPKLDEPEQDYKSADARWEELSGKQSLTKAEQKEMAALTAGTWEEKYGAKKSGGQSFSPSANPRAVRAAAVRDKDGTIYDGPYHAAAAQKYWDTKFPGDLNNDLRGWNSDPSLEEGFVTNDGKFLNREEAYQRAVELKQYEAKKADDGQLESGQLSKQQAGAYVEQRRQFSPASEEKSPTPNEEVRGMAAGYMKAADLAHTPHESYAKVNEPLAKKIADFYQNAQHAPSDPAVKKSYAAFVKETRAQWDYLVEHGVKMEPWTKKGQPYANSKELVADVRDNNHLWFFPTEGGFGESNEAVAAHPLLAKTGIEVNGVPLVVNDLFRAVHDYFGHVKEGYQFGPRGEYNAFLSHSRMYSDEARPAMAAETLGQNSWVNYGAHLRNAEGNIPGKGEAGYTAPQDRPFAEQKATVLPKEMVNQASFSSSAENMPDDKVLGRYAKRISDLTAKNGGATFNVMSGSNLATSTAPNYVVSLYPDRSLVLSPDQVTPARVSQFIKDNQDLLSNKENSIGTWHDKSSGKVYLDVSFATPNRAMAEFAGKQYNQKAIWDLKKMEEIPTGGNGEAVPDMPAPAERLGMLKGLYEKENEIPSTEVRGPLPVAIPEGAGNRGRVRDFKEVESLNLDHVLTSKDMQPYARTVLSHFRKLPGFHNLPTGLDAGLREVSKRMQANIKFLYDLSTPEERGNWKQWYNFASEMSKKWGEEFGVPADVVAAINAKLSPQTEWNDNVTLTRTILQTLKDDPKFTAGDRKFLSKKFGQIKKASERNMWLDELSDIKDGQQMSTMDDKQAGMFLRSYNELRGILKTHNHLMEPVQGSVTPWSTPFDRLRGVVSIYRDRSASNVHKELGRNHKVRSFYNNHVAPESPKWTTIDTHAVAAANMYPLGGSDEPVKANFGNPKHKNSGYNGTYFLYQHAYEQLAKEVGLLPREVQSIVWEKIRQVLSPERKRSLQSKPDDVDAIYADLKAGKINADQARQQLLETFKGVDRSQPQLKLDSNE